MGREHLTTVHSSPLSFWLRFVHRLAANVVVAHSPVEGHERAEDWWETLNESVDLRQRCANVCVH